MDGMLKIQIIEYFPSDALRVLRILFDILDPSAWVSLNIGLWIAWKNRNDAWANSFCATPRAAAALVEQVRLLGSRPVRLLLDQIQRPGVRWIPPCQGSIKINTDAALFKESCFWGLGIVMRDHLGATVCYKSVYEQGFMDIFYAESTALLQGVLLALSFGFPHVIFESDALLVVNGANSTDPSFLSCRDVLDRIRSLAKNFVSCKFLFVPSSCNNLAHRIANFKRNGQGLLPPSVADTDNL
ncbi:uncharacterized protein [Rutidosis leptorrhynchoides]|uniref:uncharacterized protein n=1 Tax=Rutidosis leptorrhynchoides TaxID=125765 RepID=UPI003A99FA57